MKIDKDGQTLAKIGFAILAFFTVFALGVEFAVQITDDNFIIEVSLLFFVFLTTVVYGLAYFTEGE